MTAPRSSRSGHAGAPTLHTSNTRHHSIAVASPHTIFEDALNAIGVEAKNRGLELQVQNDMLEHVALAANAAGLVQIVRAVMRHVVETSMPGRVDIEATMMDSPEGDRAAKQLEIRYMMNAEHARRLEELVGSVCARDCTITRSDTPTRSVCSFAGLSGLDDPESASSDTTGRPKGSLSIAQHSGGRVVITLLIDAPRVAPSYAGH